MSKHLTAVLVPFLKSLAIASDNDDTVPEAWSERELREATHQQDEPV